MTDEEALLQIVRLRDALEPFTRVTHRSFLQIQAFLKDEDFERARTVWFDTDPEKTK